ncbi:MAG: hypothetical protein EOM12_10350, partial [Verrucomicrobiae bacterium]|nr:hypothetical protein [Verrucomicrobiae bacterium]
MAGGGRAKPSSDFVAFLKEKGEWYNDMDHYESNLKQFLIDPASCDLSILSGPIETMAVLHGLEPERFRKFFDIYEAMNGVSKPRPTDDDLAFFFAYRQGVKASTAVYMNTRRVMGVHPEWPGDAALYLCETYKEMGVIFPQSKLIDRLYPDGLKYEENSRIMKFYRSQVDEKLWTLDQAVQAFIGNGRFSALGMRDLREQDGHIEHAEKDSNEWKYACPNEKGYKSLDELADKHTQSGELKHEGKNSAGAYYYRPDVIIRWISKMTGLEPVPVLKQALSKTVSKNFSGKANEAKHRTIYEQYHNDQIDLFMAGKISWPS